jgi:uncharacterized protein involved in exopolysaccharide biosynthesis
VTTTREREPKAPDFVDVDEEREVDVRRYWNALVARWWLPVVGLVAGLVVGYLFTLSGNQVYEATALVSLGTPYSLGGTSPIQGLPTNPTYVDKIVHSEYAARIAAAKAGLRPGQVRNNVSSKAVSAGKGTARTGQTPLYEITLTGAAPRKVQAATTSLADQIINQLSGYVNTKIAGYRALLASLNEQLASNQKRIDQSNAAIAGSANLSPIDRLVLTTQSDNAIQAKGILLENKNNTEQQLSLAEDVEKPQVIAPAVPTKTTARSTRNSMLVGGAIGLILGIIVALLWGPVAGRVRPAD